MAILYTVHMGVPVCLPTGASVVLTNSAYRLFLLLHQLPLYQLAVPKLSNLVPPVGRSGYVPGWPQLPIPGITSAQHVPQKQLGGA